MNILDVITGISVMSKDTKENRLKTDFGDSEQEKETKGEEKVSEGKFFTGHSNDNSVQYNLSDKDRLICYKTRLNIHPFSEDDPKPPKA